MKILYVTSEASPYVASGGLGDVKGSLPAAVKASLDEGSEVAVVLPLYTQISAEYRAQMEKVTEFHFFHAWRQAYAGVYKLTNAEGVTYYFIDNEQYFSRPSMYGQYDDGERYAYFGQAVVEFMLHTGFIPDVLHANDWQAALSVVYPRLRYHMCEELRGMKTVFTIHNIEYQGRYDIRTAGDIFDIDSKDIGILEYRGDVNLLKAAVVCADIVTTVSPAYAEELRHDYFAYGMEHIIRVFGFKIYGILNGLDTAYFDPRREDIPYPFSPESVTEGKAANKAHLQRTLGLGEEADTPLIAMVTRLTEGKGVDLVLHVFEELMREKVQFVLLGTGDERYERIFVTLCERYGDRARALLRFDRSLSKEIYAGADIFLMPSKTEPCGLAQMIACRYGAIPVVHGVGGLRDTIVPYSEEGSLGFVFQNYNAHDMLFRLKEALALYENRVEWRSLTHRAVTADFTWKRSAEAYIRLYSSQN